MKNKIISYAKMNICKLILKNENEIKKINYNNIKIIILLVM